MVTFARVTETARYWYEKAGWMPERSVDPLFTARDLVVLDRLLAEWPTHSGDHAMDVMELRTKVRRALAALDEGRTDA